MIGLLYNVPNKDRASLIPELWRNICVAFDLTPMVYMHGGAWSGGYRSYPHIYMTIEKAQEAFPEVKWVFLIAQGGKQLSKFEHPVQKVVYVIGPNTEEFDISKYHVDHAVTIDMSLSVGSLHHITAGAIVAHDRWRRNGSS